MRRWLELAIEVPAPAADAAGNWLVERGAPGVIEEDIGGERLRLRAHFDERARASEIVAEARQFLADLDSDFPGSASTTPEIATIDAEDWAEGWKQGFPPLEVGRSLSIRPPWAEKDASGRRDVVIEPAMAFGTGHHASTLGCLLAIEEILSSAPAVPSMLDVGTGSGILSIAAARLGAERVLAIDTDPIAIEAAAANVEKNALAGTIELRCGAIESVAERFGLIAANLYSGLLKTLAGELAARGEPNGWLVVAGLLDADRAAVAEALVACGWRETGSRSLDGWTTLTFRREA